MADPGFPVGGRGPRRGGRGFPRQLCFEKFICQNERIWTLRGACAGHAPSRSANAYIFLKLLASTVLVLKAKETNTVV